MIFEVAFILVVVYSLTRLSQLLARWRDESSRFIGLMHLRSGAPREIRAPRTQPPLISLGFEALLSDGRPSALLSWSDAPLWPAPARMDPQRNTAGEKQNAWSTGGGDPKSRPQRQLDVRAASGQLFRPSERPPLGPARS